MRFLSSILRGNTVEPAGEEEEEREEEEGELVLGAEDREMVASLTERLVRSIRVEQSVISLLGTILQIYKTAGHIGQVSTHPHPRVSKSHKPQTANAVWGTFSISGEHFGPKFTLFC